MVNEKKSRTGCARFFAVLLGSALVGPSWATDLDLDGDDAVQADVEGRVLLRYLSGFRGGALADGIGGDPAAYATHLDGLGLDVDGDSAVRAQGDGTLLLRYLHGLRGSALAGGVASGPIGGVDAAIAALMPNHPVDARDDAFTTTDCGPITGNVLADNGNGADSDPDGDPIRIQTAPVVAPNAGELELQQNGDFSYTPPADFIADSFVYRVGDMRQGNATATVTLSVGPDYPLDCVLRFNHLQAKGTHNSYHVQPDTILDINLDHRYTHPTLTAQLEQFGVRQFELDVHRRVVGETSRFEVFHLPFLDPNTTCQTLTGCLGEIRAWSDANPLHLPLMIWVEPKDDIDDDLPLELVAFLQLNGLEPSVIDPGDTLRRFDGCDACYVQLEEEILSVFPRQRIVTPDDVRGGADDLPAALAAGGWPALGSMRGKVVFALLDDTDSDGGDPAVRPHRGTYLAMDSGTGDLAGRLMFVSANNAASETTFPYAAMFKIDDAETESGRVSSLVSGGFMVTSNVDKVSDSAGLDDNSATNLARLTASLAAGIHFGSSDYPRPVEGVTYSFEPDWQPARCNPVAQPATALPDPGCELADIEDLPPTN